MEMIMRPMTFTALAALVLSFALCAPAIAQEQVRVFEEAPSIDDLRAILIPDLGPGKSRRIELPRADGTTAPSAAAPAPTVAAAPQPALVQSGKADSGETALPVVATAAMPKASALKAAAFPRPPRPEAAAVAFRINFASASDVIPSSYLPHLDSIVGLLRQEPTLTLTIEGHTDAYGSAEYNLELSRHRAVAVMRYLVEHGIDASRLVAVGKGKTSPMTANPFDGSNRRVQFVNAEHQSGT
jgi:outer membrane protein OmpA-like peptidoglycan-associated protein